MSPNDIVKECKDEIDEQIEKTVQLMSEGLIKDPNKEKFYQSLTWVSELVSRQTVLARYFNINQVLNRVGYKPKKGYEGIIDLKNEIQTTSMG